MVQNEVKEEVVEQAAEIPDSVPEGEVESEVAEQKERVMMVASIAGLDWAPLTNDKLEAHAEEILTSVMERIPGLTVKTSKNQHQAISHGEKRGRVICRIWFAKSKVCVETPILEGRKYVVGQSRYLDEKIGLSKKDRSAIVKEIKDYIKDRGWES